MPPRRPSTTRDSATRPPSQRRAAQKKRPAETALALTPPPRRRRVVSAAAGRPDDVGNPVTGPLPSTQPGGSTEGVQQTTEIIAQVTREVLRQLREDRSASPGTRDQLPVPRDDVLPATDVGTHVPLTGHPLTSSADDQMDGAVAGAINSLLRGDVGEQTIPQSLTLHTTELGADLSDRIPSKIWANEYVDFFELVNKVQPQQLTVSTGSSQQIISVMPQSKGRQISTIDQWTSAFLVFGAVYTQRFPEVAHGMFKYCEVVRDIAQTGPPFAWRQYDEQFRSFRQSNPMNFP